MSGSKCCRSTVRLVYILDLAEIPAFQEIGERIDADGDETVSAAEEAAYLDAKLAEIVPGLHLSVDGADLPLTVTDRTLRCRRGRRVCNWCGCGPF